MADLNIVVGRNRTGVGDGTSDLARGGKTGELNISRLNGAYAEPVMRDSVFTAEVGTAGVAPGTAISTTPPFTLWNPPNSGVLLVIYRTIFAYVSGTLGAGQILILQNAQTTKPTTGTQLVPVCNKIGNLINSKATAHSGSTLAATPTLVMPSGIFFGPYAGAAGTIQLPLNDFSDGFLQIYPGNAVSLQDNIANAGTAPKVNLGMVWEELIIT